MKKMRNTFTLGAAILAASVLSGAQAGNIVFNGEVTTSTCISAINGVQDTSVLMPGISLATLNASSTAVGQTAFNIDITGCATAPAGGTPIKVKFQAVQPVSSVGDLINQSTPGATGVNLRLLESNGSTQIPLNGQQIVNAAPQTIAAGGTSTSIEYKVSYFKADSATDATAGEVTGNVNYVVRYE